MISPHRSSRGSRKLPANFSPFWGAIVVFLALAPGCTCGSLPPLDDSRKIRTATVAGQFYPATASEMRAEAKRLFSATDKLEQTPHASPASDTPASQTEPSSTVSNASPPRVPVVLAPHAAWFFSGEVAAKAIQALPKDFRRVFLLAANHNSKASFEGISVDRAHEVHLNDLGFRVDQVAVRELLQKPGFSDVPEAHDASVLEVELPLLKFASPTGDFTIVPMMVGRVDPTSAQALAHVLDQAMNRPSDVALFSLDMSHFHPDQEARLLDKATLDALVAMDSEAIGRTQTDGPQLLLILNELAALRNLTPRVLAYANSASVPEGEPDSVVGYGAVAYEKTFSLSEAEKSVLLQMVRSSLQAKIEGGQVPSVPSDVMRRFPRLRMNKSAFVTLKKGGELRGCVGTILARQPLAEEVLAMGLQAALHDERFKPVQPQELQDLHISISVLTPPQEVDLFAKATWTNEMNEAEKFGPGLRRLKEERPGVLLQLGLSASTFLPSVWEQLPDPVHFLEALCEKQNQDADCWMKKRAKFQLYTSQEFEEPQEQVAPEVGQNR